MKVLNGWRCKGNTFSFFQQILRVGNLSKLKIFFETLEIYFETLEILWTRGEKGNGLRSKGIYLGVANLSNNESTKNP